MRDWKKEYRSALLDLTSQPPDYRKIVNSNIPPKLYKYGSFESAYWENVVFKGNIFLSKASTFNDPFDCRAKFTRKVVEHGKMYELLLKMFGKDVRKLTKEQLDCAVESLRDDIYVFCFSEVCNSILMWSHYANNNTGFCIEYDTCLIHDRIKQDLVPVLYEREYLDITDSLIKSSTNAGLICTIAKAEEWQYEKEWRLIKYHPDQKYIKKSISAIYLGVNCDVENQQKVVEWGKINSVKVYKMKRSDTKYELRPTKI